MTMCIGRIEIALAGSLGIDPWRVAVASLVRVGLDCGSIPPLDDPRPDSKSSVESFRPSP